MEDNITLGKKLLMKFLKHIGQSDLKELSIINIKKGIEEQINEYLLNTDDKYLELDVSTLLELWDKFVNLELPPTFDFYLKYFEVNEFAKMLKNLTWYSQMKLKIQTQLLCQLLLKFQQNIFMLVDEHQSIYAFRGTKNALNYTDKLFYLSTTFRYIQKLHNLQTQF